MHNARLMQVTDCINDGTYNLTCLILRVDHFFCDLIIELAS